MTLFPKEKNNPVSLSKISTIYLHVAKSMTACLTQTCLDNKNEGLKETYIIEGASDPLFVMVSLSGVTKWIDEKIIVKLSDTKSNLMCQGGKKKKSGRVKSRHKH